MTKYRIIKWYGKFRVGTKFLLWWVYSDEVFTSVDSAEDYIKNMEDELREQQYNGEVVKEVEY